ncbi:MAG: HAMP domain-containing histidine kinase [Candidatus Kerfeldbacteria bacterium]|nr:HAMP domain-containing histidine kinase [Candidatus Kerfeldbacteria bacterium]
MTFSPAQTWRTLRDNFQFIYGIFLFILIPGALVVNTVLLTSRTSTIMDIELQRKASLAASIVSSSIRNKFDNIEIVQSELVQIADQNEEIRSLDVLIPENDQFRIVASLDTTQVGTLSNYLYNTIAWQTGEPIAYQTNSAARSTEDPTQVGEERFWVIVRPIKNDDGSLIGIISMKVSSAIIDNLTQDNLNRSLAILLFSIVIIVLLLAHNARLFRNTILLQKLKEVDAMKDEFISMASHELRAPITGIRGYLQMILDGSFGPLPADVRQKLSMVNEESNRLHALVEDLLEVSRIEQGRVSLNLQPSDVAPIITTVCQVLGVQASVKGLDLVKSIQPNLPYALVDPGRFQQILMNLVSNSIKYTMHGKVTIAAEEIRDKKSMVRIKISDTGMGIAAKDRDRLFQKFYRVHNKETDKIIGTGLGLWITRELVHLMKGEIYLDSIEHLGTHVTVLVPLAPPKQISH